MILTKEQLDEYRSELPRSVWNKRCLTNFLDTIADLESRLKAAMNELEARDRETRREMREECMLATSSLEGSYVLLREVPIALPVKINSRVSRQ